MTKNKEQFIEEKTGGGRISRTVRIIIGTICIILLGLVIYRSASANPLDKYITNRDCQFMSMGDFSVATCTDGTEWEVSPFLETSN